MSFLAPLFLLGGAAIALPVVFHLIRHHSAKKMAFSSLMFLRPTPRRVTRRKRLDHLLLLLLRCVILGLLALAFARPFLSRELPAISQVDLARQTVVLIDTSASLRRPGLWAAAGAKAREVLNEAKPGDSVTVMSFDREVRTLMGAEEWAALDVSERAVVAGQRIDAEEPGWAATHLDSALIAAAELLVDSGQEEATQKRIVVISDFQAGSRRDGVQGYDWPRGLQVVFESVDPEPSSNAGLHSLGSVGSVAAGRERAQERVLVQTSLDAKTDQYQLRWAAAPDDSDVTVYVPAGQRRVVQMPLPEERAEADRLVLAGDEVDFDNNLFLALTEPQPAKVVFVGPEAPDDASDLLYFLRRAFTATGKTAAELQSFRPENGPPTVSEAGIHLLVVSGDLSIAWTGFAEQVLAQGGAVLAVLKAGVSARNLGALLEAPDLRFAEAEVSDYAMLGRIDFQHPLLRPFGDSRYGDFTGIHYWRYRQLDLDQLPAARVLAEYDSEDPALVEVPRGDGLLLILTSGWHPEDSQFALSSKFVPFLHSLLEQAGGIATPRQQFRVGDEILLSEVAGRTAVGRVTVRKPDGSLSDPLEVAGRFRETSTPGIYTVQSTDGATRFAVNLDPAESRTSVGAIDELERIGVPVALAEIDPGRQIEQRRQRDRDELESRQKLWRWLIVLALVVLMTETWLAGRLAPSVATSLETAS